MQTSSALTLKGRTYESLFTSDGLHALDAAFLQHLHSVNAEWHTQLLLYRNNHSTLPPIEQSELLIRVGVVLEAFLADLFNIQAAVEQQQVLTTSENPISSFKKYYVLKRAKKEINKAATFPSFKELNTLIEKALAKAALQTEDKELAIALLGMEYLNHAEQHEAGIETLVQWCTQALASQAGQAYTHDWVSFTLPERLDYHALVKTVPVKDDAFGRLSAPENEWRERDGFKLTDARMSAREVQDEVNYCIYCHDHDGDFCSKGFPVKKGDPAQGFKKNPLDITLTGCPLEEKISEMQFLKRDGYTLAALAMVMVDNPMCPATGHRICNDCMKSCIYQKQTPVNIPQVETRTLTDVLNLPWGVEIYDLLTRWNPLRQQQWVMKPYNGLKVLIAGMGPAGFTLAHHLLQEGFAIVGFDGLKIEPLPETLIKNPIKHFADLQESLDERIMAGFGGVAEYGITVRWDKNFLKLIYLSLMRRPHFQVFGGIRFGGTITVNDAWALGFDHFVIAVGAGLPKALPIPNSMAPGMRQANDFLMALQLGNAVKPESLTNLQLELPAIIIGGGLTGVDTATEAQAYYITQVEKIAYRYRTLVSAIDEASILNELDISSRETLHTFLKHNDEITKERARAKQENREPNFIKLIHAWGGVTIAYRKTMQASPAYINNHEELIKALEEGIFYLENVEPVSAELDEHGHTQALIIKHTQTQQEQRLPARSLLIATGTQPNTAYEFEHKGTFNRVNLQYQHYEDTAGELTSAHGVQHCKEPHFGPFTSYHEHDKRVSLIGDTHPVFHGNVVKAIASGMRTYPKILALLKNKLSIGNESEYALFSERMRHLFTARVQHIKQHAHLLELSIQAPLAASHHQPGQFYRLQNLETEALPCDDTLLQMEPLALTAASVDKTHGVLTFLVNENSASAKVCRTLTPNQPVALMGPTGVRTKIPNEHETVLILADTSNLAFVQAYGQACREAGNHVLIIAQFDNPAAIYSKAALEASADTVVWQLKEGTLTIRNSDYLYRGNDLMDALLTYSHIQRNGKPILHDVDRVYVITNVDLLKRFQAARSTTLKPHLLKNPAVVGAVYGHMQCMLKGVCAQCLQWQIDPDTGLRTKAVFACSWQDQPLEIIDLNHLEARQHQNRLQAVLSLKWVDYTLAKVLP
ncbi:MAG TPA: FAD-dependent oxidoreductase [Gammaproteobacteria bacterium]|nr:FAD-dependent oxidoreductase [Gammaproteobacteria bacterium]